MLTSIFRLLSGIVDSEEQLALLLHDPLAAEWKEESLVSRLQERLRGSYAVYFKVVHQLAATLKNFALKIGLDDQGKVCKFHNPMIRRQFRIG